MGVAAEPPISDAAPPEPPSPTPDSRFPTPGESANPDLKPVVQAAWDRLRFYEDHSKHERGQMKSILQRAGEKARTILDALTGLFRGYKLILLHARRYEAKLQDVLYRFLKNIYGDEADVGFERPSGVWTDAEAFRQMVTDFEAAWRR